MAPSADTSYSAFAESHFPEYAQDRSAKSTDVTYTTSNGAPYPHSYEAQRAGNGGLLLQDYHLIDVLSSFNRQRIPERVVHAKGAGAHGFFECTDPIDDLSCASIFSTKGQKCPVTTRFSTVGGESGSHDLARDPRGFSCLFRTDEGNLDFVMNHVPVFFLRNPASFAPFIMSQKRAPDSHLTHADDSTLFWSYLSENPEAAHMLMMIMGDRGIPDSYRHIHGYSGHTFKLVKKNGEWVYCQFHFKSLQGTGFFTQEESASKSPDYLTQELFQAIERGDHPKWSVEVQTMTPRQAEELWETKKINVFDLTHVWPHKDFPLRKIGVLTLNENPANYHSEVESVAFAPNHLVPGIEPSADPVLQSRLFAYSDAHRYRLGVNYQQLPVNKPRPAYQMGNFLRDGQANFSNQGARPTHISRLDPISFKPRTYDLNDVHGHFQGQAVSFLTEIRPEDFNGPRALWEKVFDDGARERFINNVAGKMELCSDKEILKKQIAIFREVSDDIATRLEKATGIKGYDGIANLEFSGCHNGFAKDPALKPANGTKENLSTLSVNNGAPATGTHNQVLVH